MFLGLEWYKWILIALAFVAFIWFLKKIGIGEAMGKATESKSFGSRNDD